MAKGIGNRLSKAPLVYALCQVRFSSVLSVESYVPAVQEQIRKTFPRYKKEVLQLLKISGPGGAVEPGVSNRWVFVNKENNAGFILNADSLVYHTTAYTRFAEFSDSLANGMAIVNKILNLDLVERIGLRYVDFIEPAPNVSIHKYINPGLHGFSFEKLDQKELFQVYEYRGLTSVGTMILKFSHGVQQHLLPQELQPVDLDFSRTLPTDKPSGILDTDHYWTKSAEFDEYQILQTLSSLHEHTNRAFRMAVTDKALEEWS